MGAVVLAPGDEDAAAIGAVTGYPAADVAALTLARYAAAVGRRDSSSGSGD